MRLKYDIILVNLVAVAVALRVALGTLATLATLTRGEAHRIRHTLECGPGTLAYTANEIRAALERLAK